MSFARRLRGGSFLAFDPADEQTPAVSWQTGLEALAASGGTAVAFSPYWSYYSNYSNVGESNGGCSFPSGNEGPLGIVQPSGVVNGQAPVTFSTPGLLSAGGAPVAAEWYPDEDLMALIDTAHGLGLAVMLKPMIDPAWGGGQWRANLDPTNNGAEPSAAEPFLIGQYQPFIVHYASLAQSAGVDLFCIGCELNTLVSGPNGNGQYGEAPDFGGVYPFQIYWTDGIIPAIRAVYDGPITYAGYPSDPGYMWDAVDYLGYDTYPTLSLTASTDPAELYAGCFGVDDHTAQYPSGKLACIEGWSVEYGKPVILTETGFPNMPNAAAQGNGAARGTQAQDQQAAAMCAWFTALETTPLSTVAGYFVWGWFCPYDQRTLTNGGDNVYGWQAQAATARTWNERRWVAAGGKRQRLGS